jgi:DeoR family transcriptional regulator, aga operon transcriptional repressor
MDKIARWNRLVEMLTAAEGGRLSIEQVVRELNVSAATVRRDFDELAEQQLLVRTRGGALANGVSFDLPLRYKAGRHPSEKHWIAAAAAGLLSAGQVVGLNGGTTTTEVARALVARHRRVGERREPVITVVTNALNIAHELTLQPDLKVVVLGGVARPQSYELIGPLAATLLRDISLDVAILGVDAIDAARGASAHHEGEASINQSMGARAEQVVVVADGSKVGRTAFARILPIDHIDFLVTDSSAPAEALRAIEANGCKVIVAEPDDGPR